MLIGAAKHLQIDKAACRPARHIAFHRGALPLATNRPLALSMTVTMFSIVWRRVKKVQESKPRSFMRSRMPVGVGAELTCAREPPRTATSRAHARERFGLGSSPTALRLRHASPLPLRHFELVREVLDRPVLPARHDEFLERLEGECRRVASGPRYRLSWTLVHMSLWKGTCLRP
jgi:hypothetical protein